MGDVRIDQYDEMPDCSRCGAQAMLLMQVPVDGDRVVLELCRSCDAGPGAAGRLVEYWLTPSDEKVVMVAAGLIQAWLVEAMAARGWQYMADPVPAQSSLLGDDRSAAVVAAARIGAQRDRRASLN